MKKTMLKRFFSLLMSAALFINCCPADILQSSAEETAPETSEQPEEPRDELEYQQLSVYPGKDSSELVSLDGLMPSNAELTVSKSDDSDENSICSYDITITKNGEVFQPDSEAPITVEIKNRKIGRANAAKKNMRLWHISDDGIREEITDFTVKNDTLTFRASGFSLYEIDDGTIPLRTYEFYTPDNNGIYSLYYFPVSSGREICEQTIKGEEKPIFPQLPVLSDSKTKTFIGWCIYNEATGTYDEPIDFSSVPPVTEETQGVVKVGAVYADCVFVVFHDQRNADGSTGAILATRMVPLIDDETQVQINDITATHDGNTFVQGSELDDIQAPHMEFKGWSYNYAVNEDVNADRTPLPDFITVDVENHVGLSHTIDLYPIFEPLRWITFVSGAAGSGASYIPPCAVEAETGADSGDFRVPRCEGYTFGGWYLEEEGHEAVQITDDQAELLSAVSTDEEQSAHIRLENGRLLFDHDLKLCARWTPAQTKYTIICWKQKANYVEGDDYDFEKSEQFSIQTESVVSVPESYHNCTFKGFHFGHCDSAKTVTGDGRTILNVYYDRNTHTVTFRNDTGTNILHTVNTRYGEDISGIWSFVGSDNKTYPRTNPPTSWMPVDSATYTARITRMEIMPDEDLVFDHYTTNNEKRYFYYCVEALPGAENYRTFRNKDYSLYLELIHDFNIINYNADFWELTGFTRECAATSTNRIVDVGNKTQWNNIPNSKLYFYYTRNTYTIKFMDSADNNLIAEIPVLYGDDISKHLQEVVLPEAEAGMSFSGWYFDQNCSAKANLTDMTMPAHNMIVYAGWEADWYLIEIDPNGGQLPEGTSTWFWESYHGDKIAEYIHTTRDFTADDNGEYYYHLYDREYYKLGNTWDPNESACTDRRAFYSQDLENADLTRRFKQVEKQMYQYAGWYEVDPLTGHETPFNFDQEIEHNIKIRLHWKELGAYYIDYHPGEGSIDQRDESDDDVFLLLAESVYTGSAKAVVTRTAVAPEGMNFIGWHIRGDKSGRIYPPGHSFELKESYSEITMTEDGTEKRIIIMEAVYIPIDTAAVIYDANGGILKNGMPHEGYEACKESYGGRIDVAPDRDYEKNRPLYTVTNSSVTVSHLLNNSHIKLSGDIFENRNYRFTGWNTEPDGSGIHFEAGANRLIDTTVNTAYKENPQTLYAEWEVKVYFDKNKSDSDWGGNWTEHDPAYRYDALNGLYYRTVLLNSPLYDQPPCTPHCSDPATVFRYWSLQRYSSEQEAVPPFDFDTRITHEIILYGYWNSPPEVNVHAVDATSQQLALRDSDWRIQNVISFAADETIDIGTETTARSYANPSAVTAESYVFDFACISDALIETGLNNISESRSITHIRYDTDARAVIITGGGQESVLPADQEIYLVFHKRPKDLDIGYMEMQFSGGFSEVVTVDTAPKKAAVSYYAMQDELTLPFSYPASPNDYSFCAFAIGQPNAQNASELIIITAVSDSQPPHLDIRDTWRGFEYSLNGTDFVKCGYEIQLYVIYFVQKPTIITLNEKTIGLPEDMDKDFSYTVMITETTAVKTTVYGRRPNESYTVYGEPQIKTHTNTYPIMSSKLHSGQSDSYAVFYSAFSQIEKYEEGSGWNKIYYQRVTETQIIQAFTVVQAAEQGFVTTAVPEVSDTLRYSFTTSADSQDHSVTYINTHTPLPFVLHTALAENGGLTAADELRTENSSIYTQSIDIGTVYDLASKDPTELITDNSRYVFSTIAAADVKPNGELANIVTDVTALCYQETSVQDIYGLWLNNDPESLLAGREIWFVYYEKPIVRYVEETPDGRLKLILPVTRNEAPVHLNGTETVQDALIPLSGNETLLFDQTEAGAFKVPPDLDEYDTNHGNCWKYFFNYTRIGIGNRYTVKSSELDAVYDEKQLMIGLHEGHVAYRGPSDEDWHNMPTAPVIYAVYEPKGIQMRIRKIVTGDAPADAEFTVRINSSLIKDMTFLPVSGYYADGDPVSSLEVGQQVIGGTQTGYVEFKVSHGSDVIVSGLPRGRYLVTELMPPEQYVMTATANGSHCTLDEENSFHIIINDDTDIVLNNKFRIVPVTGTDEDPRPYRLLSAVCLTSAVWLMYAKLRRKKDYENI